jgi:glycoside/pentoside/hexuronide:cation symporter, GPH family
MAEFSLKRSTIAAYSLPAIPVAALGLPLAVFVAPYYITDVGIEATIVSIVFMLVRVADVIFDPLFGFVADHTRTKWGRRRHWLVLSTPVLMLSVWMFFVPPENASWVHMAVWVTVIYLGYSVITIAHASWGAELSMAYHERSRVQAWREFSVVSGMLLVLLLPSGLEVFFNASKAETIAAMGWFIIVLLPITVAIAILVPERDFPPQHDLDVTGAWRLVAKNGPMKRILLTDLLFGTATSVTATLYVILIAKVFGLGQYANTLLLVYFVAGLVGIPIWIHLSYKFGKHRTLAGAAIYASIALPLNLIAPHDGSAFWWLVVLNVLYGLAYGAGLFLMRSIMADVVDQETAETGKERMGVYFSFLILTNKLGYAFSILSLGILAQLGFDARPGVVNSPESLVLVQLFFVGVPAILFLTAAWVMWHFPIDEKRQQELRDVIAARAFAAQEIKTAPVASPTTVGPAPNPGPAPAE